MKKVLKLMLCMCVMLVSVYLIHDHYKDYNVQNEKDDFIANNDDDYELISELRTKYSNNEIVMYLEIPGVLSTPIVQTENNSYYLNHNIYREESNKGIPYLDYRNKSLNDRKLILYGHNRINMALIFSKLLDYQNESFYKEHSDIKVYSDHGKKIYRIFSVFTEKDNFDYLDLNGFPGDEYYSHLSNLKDKSIYDTGVSIDNNSKVLVIQTCSSVNGCDNIAEYQVMVAVELKTP